MRTEKCAELTGRTGCYRHLHVEYGQRQSLLQIDNCDCTDFAQLQKYLQLSQKGSVIAEYVWIDASGGTRSKCKVSGIGILVEDCWVPRKALRTLGSWMR